MAPKIFFKLSAWLFIINGMRLFAPISFISDGLGGVFGVLLAF